MRSLMTVIANRSPMSRSRRSRLSKCAAYGDSYSDLPMLECVGDPRVVSPQNSLRIKAQKEGWPVLEWGAETTGENGGAPVAA